LKAPKTDKRFFNDINDKVHVVMESKKDIHDKFSADNPVADLWKAPKD